jgi:hypothetical protein
VSYMYTVLASMGDPQGFADAGSTWAGDRMRELGATDLTASQIIMGGEMSGLVIVGFQFESIDAAMAGQAGIYQDAEMLNMMRETQVSVNRRVLFRIQGERGERTGQYGSVIYLAGRPIDDATAEANIDHSWKTIQEGANGMMGLAVVAGGPAQFAGTVVTSTDSLDALIAASAKNFADPELAKRMSDQGWGVVGRVMMKRLI